MGNRQAVITTALSLHGDDVVLERATCSERLSEPFTIVADVMSEHGQVDFLPHLGSQVHISMEDWAGVSREFDGVLFEAEEIDESGAGLHYRLVIWPWFWLLSQNLNTRIWQNMTVLDIVKKVFDLAGASAAYQIDCSHAYVSRDYCVQFRESDFAFVSRLLEEEGIHYYFVHTNDRHMMHLSEPSSAHPEHSHVIDFIQPNQAGGDRGTRSPHFYRWSEQVRPGTHKVVLRDSNFEIPDRNMEAEKAAPAGNAGRAEQAEHYDYPGGFGLFGPSKSLTENKVFVEHRLDTGRAERRRFIGEGTAFGVACGQVFEINDPRDKLVDRFEGKFRAIGATHVLVTESYRSGKTEAGQFTVHVEAIPSSTPWRPMLRTPKPTVGGVQTALVVGPAGEVIHTDKYARVKVQFPWDRLGKFDDFSSCWVRVSQIWADGNFGGVTIPRIGEEVLVDFMDGDPDLPIIVGRVYNAKRMPPLNLPTNKTQSTWKSQTVGTSGDGYPDTVEPPPSDKPGYNEIRYEDKGGHEEINVHAQRDMKTWVRRNEHWKVGQDAVIEVGHDRNTEIKRHETLLVKEGDETRTVKKGSRKTVIHMKDDLTVETGDSILTVQQANRIATIHSDDTLTVEKGNMKTTVEEGDYTLTVKKGEGLIDVKKKLVLKVGSSTITMTPTSIEIESTTIKVSAKASLETTGPKTDIKGTMITATAAMIKLN